MPRPFFPQPTATHPHNPRCFRYSRNPPQFYPFVLINLQIAAHTSPFF